MFCKECGNTIEKCAKFCSKCGSPIRFNDKCPNQTPVSESQNIFSFEAHKNDSVGTLISNLETAIPIYQTLTGMNEKLEHLKSDKSYYSQLFSPSDSNRKITTLLLLYYLITGIFNKFFRNYIGITLLLFGIVIFISLKEACKLLREIENNHQTEIKTAEDQIKQYFIDHECPALYCVPEKYQYYIAVNYIYDCLKNGRANSLKEAINLYEEQCYRWKMEASQQQLHAKLDEQARMLNRIEAEQGI